GRAVSGLYPLLSAAPCGFATAAVIGSGWLLLSNQISAYAGHNWGSLGSLRRVVNLTSSTGLGASSSSLGVNYRRWGALVSVVWQVDCCAQPMARKNDRVILVIGATGRQGGAVLRRLRERGFSVR